MSSRRPLVVALVASFALVLGACGGDDDTEGTSATEDDSATVPAEPSDTSGDDGGLAAGDSSDLVVPLDYLQGEWCNTDGEAWLFEGETARFGETHDALVGELPVTLALAAGSERVLVSQTADEFVLDLQIREVTFTRGRC